MTEDYDDVNVHDSEIEAIWKEEISADEKLVKIREYYEPKIQTLNSAKNSLADQVRSLSGEIARQNRNAGLALAEIGRLTVENLRLLSDQQHGTDSLFNKELEKAKAERLLKTEVKE